MNELKKDNVITAENIGYSYGERRAVEALSFTVRRGEVVGLLGPNGAGKTTTIRLLNGLLIPAVGSIQILGYNPVTEGEALREHTGVLTETPALYERLTARQNLEFFGSMFGMRSEALIARITEVLEMFALSERANDRVSTFSKGMKQRLALGRALLHNPDILFLDEPTSGLDPEASQQVLEIIDNLRNSDGHTVLLCTHNLFEAQRLCDRVVIMNKGKLLAVGALDELRQRYSSGMQVKLRFLQAVSAQEMNKLLEIQGVNLLKTLQKDTFLLDIAAENVIPQVVEYLINRKLPLVEVHPEIQSLEEIYFTIQKKAGVEI